MFLEQKAREKIKKIGKEKLEEAFIETYKEIAKELEKTWEHYKEFENKDVIYLAETEKTKHECYEKVLMIFEQNLNIRSDI